MNVVANAGYTRLDPRQVLTPGRLLQSLWRGRWVVAGSGVLAALFAFSGARLLPRQYTADSVVAIETQRFLIPELQGALSGETSPDPMPWVRTEMQVMRSRGLLRGVVEDLRLDADPDFNLALRTPSLLEHLRSGLLALLPGAPATESGSEADDGRGVVNEINRRLGVTHDNRSLIIGLSFTAQDPDKAAAVLNALVRRFIEARAEARSAANRGANTALIERLAEVRSELEALQRRIQERRSQNSLVELRAGSVGQQQLEELATALTRVSTERAQLEANWQRTIALARTGSLPTEHSEVVASQTIARLRDRETEAARLVGETADRYGPRHPDRRAAEAELAAIRGQIMAEARRVVAALGSQVEAARAREADLGRQLERAQQAANRLATVQADLAELENQAEGLRALYRTLQERAAQTAADPRSAAQIPGVRVISSAVPPSAPSSPRPLLTSGLGLLVGIGFGGVLILLRRSGLEPFTRPEEVIEETGLPVLGAVPRRLHRRADGALPVRVSAAPSGPEAEALRALRGRLRFAGRGAGAPRSVAFVSSLEGESAANVAAAFARVAAGDGVRTLLLSGDLQRPVLGRVLGKAESDSLITVLEGGEAWRDAVETDDGHGRLDLLLAGEPHEAAVKLLESMRLQNVLIEATEEYNLVVMTSPPATLAAGAMALARRVDAVVLVIEAGQTPRQVVLQAVKHLAAASRNLAGVVWTG